MKQKTIFVVLILILGISISSCSTKEHQNESYIYRVKTEKVQHATKTEITELSGVVKEANAVNLSFRVAGPIQKMHVVKGSFVKKGELIAEMDPRDYTIQLSVAQAEYDKVIDEVTRVKELYNRKSVSEADYQKAIAGEQMITAKLNHAKDQLNDTKIYAPFNGYIQNLNYQQGEIINIGMPFASIINVDYYNVEIDIPASLFVIRDRFIGVACESSINPDKTIPMDLLNYDIIANSSRLFHMVYKLNPKADKFIAPGMEVKVFIEYSPDNDNRISIPVDAIFNDNGEPAVWIFNEADSTISRRKVVADKFIGNGRIVIKEGLIGAETIVTAGVNTLKDGIKVSVIQPKAKTNIGGLL